VLTQSRYYVALGLVVDAALSRILEDILALPDITEEESHRLSELCRIFNSLEGLFFVNMDEASDFLFEVFVEHSDSGYLHSSHLSWLPTSLRGSNFRISQNYWSVLLRRISVTSRSFMCDTGSIHC
jgi:hypothetical protein